MLCWVFFYKDFTRFGFETSAKLEFYPLQTEVTSLLARSVSNNSF